MKVGVAAALLVGFGGWYWSRHRTRPPISTVTGANSGSSSSGRQTPLITLSVSSELDGGRNYAAFDLATRKPSSHFSFSSARLAQAGTSSPTDSMVAGVQNTSIYDMGNLAVDWSSDAPLLEIPLYAKYGALRLVVDGQECIDAHQNAGSSPFAMPRNDGSLQFIRIDWTNAGGRRARHYRAEVGGFFAGARVGRDDVLSAPSTSHRMRVAFVGDSYTEGTGANTIWEGFAAICARQLNVEPVFLGSGGTGYIHVPFAGRLRFIERLGDLKSLSPAPDAIVVMGGINDNVPDSALAGATSSYFKALKQNFPRTKIIVFGPWNPKRRDPDTHANIIKNSALSQGVPFVDVRFWLPASNTPEYIGSDTTHPTILGHRYLGQRVATALKPFLTNK